VYETNKRAATFAEDSVTLFAGRAFYAKALPMPNVWLPRKLELKIFQRAGLVRQRTSEQRYSVQQAYGVKSPQDRARQLRLACC